MFSKSSVHGNKNHNHGVLHEYLCVCVFEGDIARLSSSWLVNSSGKNLALPSSSWAKCQDLGGKRKRLRGAFQSVRDEAGTDRQGSEWFRDPRSTRILGMVGLMFVLNTPFSILLSQIFFIQPQFSIFKIRGFSKNVQSAACTTCRSDHNTGHNG